MFATDAAPVLEAQLAEMLSDAAFMMADALDEEPEPWEGDVLQVVLAFSGAGEGRLVLSGDTEFGAVLAANLLGLEPDDPAAQDRQGDGMGEFLNILAGGVMREVFGAEAVYDLAPPKVSVVSPDEAEAAHAGAAATAGVLADIEYRVVLSLFSEGAPAQPAP